MPLLFPRVAVVGLGLIGGSVAKTIKRRFPETYVIAVDADAATLQAALNAGVADEALPVSGMADAAGADLVVLATHGDAALDALTALAPLAGPETVITDTCSTKAELMDHALELKKAHPALCYVGGHPMAGSDKAGFKHSSDHLLENAAYLLCPMPGAEQALERLSAFLAALGALPLTLDPGEHDLYMAAISHLPHVAAAGLVNVAHLHDDEKGTLRVLAAGGFRDLTRIASSPPALWHGITVSNRECLMRLLLDYITALEQFCRALNWGDSKAIQSFFARAQEYRDSFAAAGKNAARPALSAGGGRDGPSGRHRRDYPPPRRRRRQHPEPLHRRKPGAGGRLPAIGVCLAGHTRARGGAAERKRLFGHHDRGLNGEFREAKKQAEGRTVSACFRLCQWITNRRWTRWCG